MVATQNIDTLGWLDGLKSIVWDHFGYTKNNQGVI